jgi:6-phosphogluconolactonase (cycloisomerase 2 family)
MKRFGRTVRIHANGPVSVLQHASGTGLAIPVPSGEGQENCTMIESRTTSHGSARGRMAALAAAVAVTISGVASAWGQSATRTVFVSNNVSDSIAVFTMADDGTLTLIGNTTVPDTPQTVALSPDGRLLAIGHATAADNEILEVYRVGADASLTFVASIITPGAPLGLIWVSNTVVAATETALSDPNQVHTYFVNEGAGMLNLVDSEITGTFNTYLAVTGDRSTLFAQDSGTNTIRTFGVDQSGMLTLEDTLSTGSLYPLRMGVTRDSTKLYSVCGISGGGNKIMGFTISSGEGLTPLPGSPYLSPGASPAYIDISSDDQWAFIGHGTDATVRTFAIAADGALSSTGFSFDVGLQGTVGDVRVLDEWLLVTDESSAIDGITGLYCFLINPDGSFTAVAPIYSTNGVRPEAIEVWSPPQNPPADMNCDGVVNSLDIEPFVLALTDPDAYALQYPDCDIDNADVNGDGAVNTLDIEVFVDCILNGGCP